MKPLSPRAVIAGLLVLSLAGLSACATNTAAPEATGETSLSDSAGPSPSTSPSPSPSPSPTLGPLSPLTGLEQSAPAPVLVVKLDNTRNALPHAGLKSADIVYIEEVEYGITRLAAVFNSVIPDRIGPVRSARITDLDLLGQYGNPGFAFSGAQQKLWPAIADSPLVDLSANKSAADYQRDTSRRAPYNYFLNGQDAISGHPEISLDTDIGFVFSAEAPPNGLANKSATIEWSYASARFVYDPIRNQYAVRLNGERATAEEGDGLQWADTVVIQQVKQTPSKYFDKGGGNTPHAETIGDGKAVILRDGFSYDATWSRESSESGTSFTDEAGNPIAFKPGQTWIALFDKSREIELRPKAPRTPATPSSLVTPTSPNPS